MKYIKLSILASCILLSAAFPAKAQKENPPKPAPPKDFVLPGKKQSTFPNGFRTTLVQYGQIPKVYVRLIIKTGNVHEGPDQIWLSDLLASLMEEGTTSLTAQQLAKKTAGMGGSIGVNSSPDEFTIYGSALSQYAPELVRLIADVVLHPALPAKEIGRLKQDLKRNLAISKGVPQSIANEKFSKIIYGDNSPYGMFFPTEEMIESYTIDQVKKFYNDNIGARRSVLYVAGQFNEAAVNSMIRINFNTWKPGPDVQYPSGNAGYTPQVSIIDRKGAPQTTVYMGLPVVTPANPDYLPLTVANSLLGGSFASRITSNIRENKGYTYSPNSSVNSHPKEAVWYEDADITSEHTVDAINEIKKEITRLASEAPSESELAGIQRYSAGIFVLQNSTPGGIISQLNFLDLFGLDDSYLTNRVKNIYAVTPQQVSDMVRKYLVPEKMSIVMVGDEKSIKEQQAKASQ